MSIHSQNVSRVFRGHFVCMPVEKSMSSATSISANYLAYFVMADIASHVLWEVSTSSPRLHPRQLYLCYHRVHLIFVHQRVPFPNRWEHF